MSSRWATTNEDDADVKAVRKKQKEEKRRLKEEKERSALAERARIDNNHEYHRSETDQPAKRQRTISPVQEGATLLEFPSFPFCPSRGLDDYEVLNSIEEGSYGFVSRARNNMTDEIVALKRLKVDQKTNEGFPVTGLREIQTLRACSHAHIVNLREVVVGPEPLQE